MKKIFLFFMAALLCITSFAQRAAHITANPIDCIQAHTYSTMNARTTAIGDTMKLTNIPATDTVVIYKYGNDSGYIYGTNAYGDQGFAERYDFNLTDSTVIVLGVMAQFGGKVNPASINTVSFMLWDITAPLAVSATFGYSGFPQNGYDTITVPYTELGIGAAVDTMKAFLFPEPALQKYSFFVGYTTNYNYSTLAGDTIGLASSKNGERDTLHYSVTITPPVDSGANIYDTLINVKNATQTSDANWYDNYSQIDSIYNDLAIFPIVVIADPSGMSKITRNNLSLYGNYPNPAVNCTNIKFSIARTTTVTIQIAEMTGKVLSTIQNSTLESGEHIVPVSTDKLTPGNYLYIIHTSDGAAIAGQITVTR